MAGWAGGAAQAHAATPQAGQPWTPDPGKPNHANPTQGATSHTRPSNATLLPKLGTAPSSPHIITRPLGAMKAALVSLSPGAASTYTSSDGLLEIDIPAGAITSADQTSAGGKLALRIEQIAPGSGGNAGGSGLVSLGTYLLQVVDADGYLATTGLRRPIQARFHYPARAGAFDLSQLRLIVNASTPEGIVAALPRPASVSPGRAVQTGSMGGAPTGVISGAAPGLGAPGAQATTLDASARTISAPLALSSPTTSISWDTSVSVATFGKPDPFSEDLSGGALTTSIPLDIPAGPGGLTPPLALAYSSASVADQHNPQAAAGWLGEGWSLGLGEIDWAEHNVTSDCLSTCGATWEDSWQLSDPFGTAAELLPPNINVSTYYDDTPNGITPSPVQWRTTPESRAKVYSFQSAVSLPDGAGKNPPCFRVFLPNGIMEEFGCTSDSLEYYYTPGMGDYVTAWKLDLITDRQGAQIHVTYWQDIGWVQDPTWGWHQSVREAELASVQWDSPSCHDAQTACAGAAWAPQMQVVFNTARPGYTSIARLGQIGGTCNSAGLRCDDPEDLLSQGGLAAPVVQNVMALNDAAVQARASGTGSWNTLRDYQFSYQASGPGYQYNGAFINLTDPVTGQQESTAGAFLLTKIQEVGDDGATTLPPYTLGYSGQPEYYVDSTRHPSPATNCDTLDGLVGWNVYSNCPLWSRTYNGNGFYLTTFDNGQGMQEAFTWVVARNNTHGVDGGGANDADPFFCDNGAREASYPCNQSDDQNWSRIVLTQTATTTVRASSAGPTNVTNTTTYSYDLTYPLAARECGDCIAGMYWGNQNDGDVLDFYNGKFMGFAEVDVNAPDGSVQKHKFYATNGYGVYDKSQVNCYSGSSCNNSPWWLPGNALHGQEYEVDSYDTNGTTLLSKTTTQYQVNCPAPGVPGTSSSPTWGNWDGALVSELDHNNPVASCETRTSQTSRQTLEGSSSGPQMTTSYAYTNDPSTGYLVETTATTNLNDGADGSPTTTAQTTWNLFNDAVSATSTGATGTYLVNLPMYQITAGADGVPTSCLQTLYPGSNGSSGSNPGVTSAEVIAQTRFTTTCGYQGNNWTLAGPLKMTTAYDASGNAIGTTDPDANVGVAGHAGCTVGGVSYSACTGYDATYDALPATQANALNQSTSSGYSQAAGGGWGLWPISVTDADDQVTSYTYDALGRRASATLPGEANGSTQTWSYTDWCAATGAQTPCVEVDETQRLAGSATITQRAFYDGLGQLVETRTPAPGGQDVVVYHNYDYLGRDVFDSNPYYVAAYTGAPGSAAFALPDASQPGTQTTYVTRLQTNVTDALGHTTRTYLATQCGIQSDGACYTTRSVFDPEGHAVATWLDALGRSSYVVVYTGTGPYPLYSITASGYVTNGDLATVTRPDGKTITESYDLAGRQTGLSDPDRGNESYSYDADGNLTTTVDARGISGTTWMGYDGLNRPLWRNTTDSQSGAYVTYSYDATTGGNDGIGRLTGETFSNANVGGALSGSYATTYDARGQVTATTATLEGTPYATSASYNDAGELTTQTYPNGDTLTTSYDPASGWATGESVQLSGAQSATPLLANESYSGAAGAMGLLTSATLGAFSGGSGAYVASYDPLGRPTSSQDSYTPTGGSASTLYQTQPTYDALGNVIAATTTLPQGTDTQVFCYDDLSRLIWAGSSGTPACSGAPTPSDTGSLAGTSAQYSASYSYDTMNRLTAAPLGSYTYSDSAHADAATSIGSVWTASYDASGNMTCRAASSATTCAGSSPTGAPLSYDNEGRLAGWQNTPGSSPTQSASYLYDGAGQRVQQVATSSGGATTTSYIGNLEEVTSSGGTSTTTTAYYGGLAENVNGALSYLLSDGLGSATASVATTSGAVTATQLYGPYGGVRYQSGTLPTSKGYTGQRSDVTTSGLDYYGARYYDAVAGQFTSADTMLAGGLNEYAYVAGNPETKTDPSGHCPWCIAGAIIGAVVGAGIVYGVQVYNNYQSGASNPWTNNIDWGAVGMGALAGAFVGATMGAGATAVAGVFAAGGSVGTAVTAGAGAAAMFAGYGIVPTAAGAEATDVEIDAELGLAGNRAARATSAPSAPPVNETDPQEATPSGTVWYNRHGQLTNGAYTVDEPGMQPHLPYTEASRLVDPNNGLPKSVFLSDIDAHKAVLDAAMYADNQALWSGNTADVPVTNGPTGVDGQSGWLVNGITVSRTHTNFVHGWPNEVP